MIMRKKLYYNPRKQNVYNKSGNKLDVSFDEKNRIHFTKGNPRCMFCMEDDVVLNTRITNLFPLT